MQAHIEYPVCLTLQPLSVKTSSLAVAENMADLIDGYCRLEGSEKSLIIRPSKGTLSIMCFPGNKDGKMLPSI